MKRHCTETLQRISADYKSTRIEHRSRNVDYKNAPQVPRADIYS